MYNNHQYLNKLTAQPPIGPPRRHPFATAVSHNVNAVPQTQEKVKPPTSPPLPRQNSKTVPPSPPKVIADRAGRYRFERKHFLGEGGFARVYQVQSSSGRSVACKVVTKSSLKTKKAKTKLYAEIKIHQALTHPNIVTFEDCFEDDENVYMILELCERGSLMDMLRRRRRFTEPEARFFMIQLIGASHYMHTHQVIHRDLKLGNLFLDHNMNVKVGDFGLAALIENPGERKKTICGTPNYIAPEVLFDQTNGHSFEVDIWSIGVILYTLVVGRPPFQTKEVEEIYKRIRANDYGFPADRAISENSKELVQLILAQDPVMRPTLHEIIDHAFFTMETFPDRIPVRAWEKVPDFGHINRSQSARNYSFVRRAAQLDDDQITSIAIRKPSSHPTSHSDHSSGLPPSAKQLTSTIAQQEKEFQKAVQPGSPISALLSSARQPLLVNPAPAVGEGNLFRKLQAAQVKRASPLRPKAGHGLQNIEQGQELKEKVGKRKEVEAQKARIVAQMAPVIEEEKPVSLDSRKEVQAGSQDRMMDRENLVPGRGELRKSRSAVPAREHPAPRIPSIPTTTSALSSPADMGTSLFHRVAQVLTKAFQHMEAGRTYRNPEVDAELPVERVFVASWVDYCNKYGMAYAFTDGSIGVHFNDTTTLVLSADKLHFEFISFRNNGAAFVRKLYTVDTYPEELKNKVYLLKHFEKYIVERLLADREYHFEDTTRTRDLVWVPQYLRIKHVIVFQLSHDVLQFNFYDHTKLILSSLGLVVTYIDKNYKLTRWTLSQITQAAVQMASHRHNFSPEEVKLYQRLLDKLKYCAEVLVSIHTASTSPETQVPERAKLGASGRLAMR